MERAEVLGALEAILFVAGEPMGASDLKRIVERYWADLPEDVRGEGPPDIGGLLDELRQRWSDESARGFTLVSVAGGYTFRSNPRFAGVLQAMQTQRPVRLSRAAIETLAIIAYRQPITKPEVDHIRGVDCGSAIRLLLDRQLVRIVGKREEAGRPLLYGTSKQFLSFFNLPNLNQLPTLRELTELNELSEESRAELGDFEELVGSVAGTQPVDLSVKNEPSIEALDQAMQDLKERQRRAAEAFLAEGITLKEDEVLASEPVAESADSTQESAASETGAPAGEPVVTGVSDSAENQAPQAAPTEPTEEAATESADEEGFSWSADSDGDEPEL